MNIPTIKINKKTKNESRPILFDADRIAARDYWLHRLADAPRTPCLEPEAPRRPGVASVEEPWIIDGALFQALKKLSGGGPFLLYTTVMAALKVVLFKYSGRTTIAVGGPARGSEVENNALVILDELEPGAGFKNLLLAVRQTLLDAYARQRYPFERCLADLGVDPSVGLFDVLFRLTDIHGEPPATGADVEMRLTIGDDRLHGFIGYRPERIRRPRIVRLIAHLAHVLRQALAAPETPLSRLALLDDKERRQLIEGLNPVGDWRHPSWLVHERIETVARSHPDAPALAMVDGETLDYRTLNARANQLAHELRRRGVGADVPVGICLQRSPELIIAVLAVLKAGGAYLPLEPDHPPHRLALILADAGVERVVTRSDLLDRLPDAGIRPLLLDGDRASIDRQSIENPGGGPRGADLAYVLYTSGSTGRPKGCQVEQRNLSHYLAWAMDHYFQEGQGGDFGLFTPISFDLTVTSLFLPLLRGRTLWIYPPEWEINDILVHVFDPANAIDCVKLTPSHVSMLGWLEPPPTNVRLAILGGEALSLEQVRILHRLAPEMAIHNEYGPTETTVGCIVHRLHAGDEGILIGKPIDRTHIHILDEDRQPVPIAVAGEIYIGGAGVARGYLNRPSLNRALFIDSPFRPGERLYRSGDLARWTENGAIEYLHRKDGQIKIRGHRIERGEVETTLLEHAGVEQVALEALDVDGSGPELVLYWVAVETVGFEALREWLQARLPAHMVPNHWQRLAVMPLTANGKIDRAALPPPEIDGSGDGAPAKPGDAVQARLLDIWRQVLGREKIGIGDNFFNLGGQSLKATQVVSRIRREFGVDIAWSSLFEQPTVREMAALIAAADATIQHPLQRIADAPHYALSDAQRRLWVLDGLVDDPATFNITSASLIEGPLRVDALQRALRELMVRHETLRTTFIDQGDTPRQVVHASLPPPWRFQDFSAGAAPEERARAVVRERAGAVFDLRRGPLWGVDLLRLQPQRYLFIFTIHHIICDGWSMAVFSRDLQSLYHTIRADRQPELKPLAIHYRDYAAWQLAALPQWQRAGHRDFWLRELAAPLPLLDLPGDFPRPPVQEFRGDAVTLSLEPALVTALRRVDGGGETSLFMIALALVRLSLFRWSGQAETIIGAPVGGRDRLELEDQIGFYVNMLALRGRVDGRASFVTLLTTVADHFKRAYEHRAYPFDRLVEELGLVRDMARQPLFDVVVTMNERPPPGSQTPELIFAPFGIGTEVCKYDLAFFFTERADGGCDVGIEYARALFTRGRMERMAAHLHTLATAIVATPDRSVERLNPLPAWEWRAVIENFNAVAGDYPRDASLTALFERWARRTPERLAVLCGQRSFTYRQLDGLANRLARDLVTDHRLTAGEVVGVFLDRSEWTAVALLGILKAGGAYLPIDPGYPEERVRFLLTDTDCRILVTDADRRPELNDRFPERRFLDVKAGPPLAKPPPVTIGGDDLAYVIYTSGSTGRPKGVLVEHRAVARLVCRTNFIQLTAGDRVLQTGSLAFDASTFEIWGPLLNGATVCFPRGEVMLEPAELAALIRDAGITVMFLTTGLFNRLVDVDIGLFQGLRVLLTGGEQVSAAHMARVRQHHPGLALNHVYGPTENTCFTSYHPVDRIEGNDVPIGGPIANSTLYLLDGAGQPAPIGIPGEIHTGGDGLARGYLGRPALTAETFIPNPFATGQRLYRTGDLGVWDADGRLTFLGRLDNQVKVRGFRIEPGEIEMALCAHALVKTAVVVAREIEGGRELVAYWSGEGRATVAELREFLSARLPRFMVPARFIHLPRLPLNRNGKVDRAALPDPETVAIETGPVTAPRTEPERILVSIWESVLAQRPIGIDDDYFERGGDSIKAIQIVNRLQQQGWTLAVRDLFQLATIARIVPALKRRETDRQRPLVNRPTPLTAVQRWFFAHHHGPIHHFNQSVSLRAGQRLDENGLRTVLAHIRDHHDALRLRFETVDGAIVQTHAATGGPVTLEVADLRGAADADEQMKSIADRVQAGFDLARGPVMAAVLFRLDGGDRLFWTIHHLAVDTVSWRILLEDLETGYRQHLQGRPITLLPATDPFQAWALACESRAAAPETEQWSPFWQKLLQQPVTTPKTDLEGGGNRYATCRSLSRQLTREETDTLSRRSHHAYHTEMNHLLLAALAMALKNWHGGDRTLVTLEGHGREPLGDDPPRLDRTVGWFTSLFPVVLDVSDPRPGATIKRVKETLRQLPAKGVSHGLLRWLRSDRPLTDVEPVIAFNYLGEFSDTVPADPLFSLEDDTPGRPIAPELSRQHHLDIGGVIVQGCLQLTIAYDGERYRPETMAALLDDYQRQLKRLAVHCAGVRQGEKTPSDFTAADRFTLDDYDALLHERGWRAAEIEDIAPLSPMQEGMLYQSRLDPDSRAYCLQMSYRLRGPLDADALQNSWADLCQRHEILRTLFLPHGSAGPLQVVMKNRPPEWIPVDLSALDAERQHRRIDELTGKDLERGFDLERDPLLRIHLLRLSGREHLVVWSYHHILLDGWCLHLLLNDLGALYRFHTGGQALPRPTAPPYRDYIRWLQSRDRQSATAWWRHRLAGFERTTGLPAPLPAESGRGYRLHETEGALDRELSAALQTLAAQRGVIHQRAAELGIEGAGYSWKHHSMDWRQAMEWSRYMVENIHNSICFSLYGMSQWGVAYLVAKGYPLPWVKALGKMMLPGVLGSLDDREKPFGEREGWMIDLLRGSGRDNGADPSKEMDRSFWRRYLDGWSGSVSISPLGGVEAYRRSAHACVEGDLALELHALAKDRGTSAAMLWLALFELLLFQLSRQADLCIGVVHAGRRMPFRLRVTAEMDFDDLLTAVIDGSRGAFIHGEHPPDFQGNVLFVHAGRRPSPPMPGPAPQLALTVAETGGRFDLRLEAVVAADRSHLPENYLKSLVNYSQTLILNLQRDG